MSRRKRILFVSMHHSIHTARWIESIDRTGLDLHMFPLDADPPHSLLRDITLHTPVMAPAEMPDTSQRLSPAPSEPPAPPSRTLADRAVNFASYAFRDPKAAGRLVSERGRHLAQRLRQHRGTVTAEPQSSVATGETERPPLRVQPFLFAPGPGEPSEPTTLVRLGQDNESDAARPALHGPHVLARLIHELQPDLIHSMEFQHNAYRVLAARDVFLARYPGVPFPRWLATNWGSDIFNFGNDERHARQIRRVCAALDLYSCECRRDNALGRQFGYRGPELPVLPNSGGVDVEAALRDRSPEPPSRRKVIMIKGYDHFAGRAMTTLSILERFAERLRDYEIVMFSVGARPRVRALELKAAGTLNITVVDWATHEQILAHFGRARLYMGISISDGISTSVLEAMLMGAFPVQTNTACCDEWFVPGETGFAVPPDDIDAIAAHFERALSDDALVDAAAPRNLDIIRARLDRAVIGPQVQRFYASALAPNLAEIKPPVTP